MCGKLLKEFSVICFLQIKSSGGDRSVEGCLITAERFFVSCVINLKRQLSHEGKHRWEKVSKIHDTLIDIFGREEGQDECIMEE